MLLVLNVKDMNGVNVFFYIYFETKETKEMLI